MRPGRAIILPVATLLLLGLSNTLTSAAWPQVTGTVPRWAGLHGVKSVRVSVDTPSEQTLRLDDDLRRAGLTEALIVETIRKSLKSDLHSLIAPDPASSYVLAVRCVAERGPSRRKPRELAVWVDVRVVTGIERDLGSEGRQALPLVLWESSLVYFSDPKMLKADVLETLRSMTRRLDADWLAGNPQNSTGRTP